jgi:hypothetical protein
MNHLIWKVHSKKLENTFLQFNIVLILLKSFKNKIGMTLIFFVSDVIGQYIITEKQECSLIYKRGNDICLSDTYQDTSNVYNSSLKLLW